jgi:hypothetical protein
MADALARLALNVKAHAARLDALAHEITWPWQGFSLNKN